MKRRLILLGEGKGDKLGCFQLVKRLISEYGYWDSTILSESDCLKAGALPQLFKDDCRHWREMIGHAMKRPNFGGVLLVLDGDTDRRVLREEFCAKVHARRLAAVAKSEGAGQRFSASIAFACCEFESWLIAGVSSLAGRSLGRGRGGVRECRSSCD